MHSELLSIILIIKTHVPAEISLREILRDNNFQIDENRAVIPFRKSHFGRVMSTYVRKLGIPEGNRNLARSWPGSPQGISFLGGKPFEMHGSRQASARGRWTLDLGWVTWMHIARCGGHPGDGRESGRKHAPLALSRRQERSSASELRARRAPA